MDINTFKRAYDIMPCGIAILKILNFKEKSNIKLIYYNKELTKLMGMEDKIFSHKFINLVQRATDPYILFFYDVIKNHKEKSYVKYVEKINRYIRVTCFYCGENYCGCMFTDDRAYVLQEKTITAMAKSYFFIASCDLDKDTFTATIQTENYKHVQKVEGCFSEYVKKYICRIVADVDYKKINTILSADYIKKNVTRKDSTHFYEFRTCVGKKQTYIWRRMGIMWVSDNDYGQTREIVFAVQDIEDDRKAKNRESEKKEKCISFDIAHKSNMVTLSYSCSQKRALIVDDSREVCRIMKKNLENINVSADIVHNGRDAVNAYKQSNPGQYNIIFMDIQMPEMNGYKAARLIRNDENCIKSKIPIVAMTARVCPEDVLLSTQAGMNEHIGKPFDQEEIQEVMKRWIL